MEIITLLVILLLILLILFFYHKFFDSDDEQVFRQYNFEELNWLKNSIIYPSIEVEIQSVVLNPSDDKSLCYQKGNRIYCMEIIRTSDIEHLHKELTVNGKYLKGKLQETLHQQHTFGQVPNLKVLGIAVLNEKFIIVMELIK
ncbi:hypothetical protein HLK66_00930 [Niallia circulans]|uniref:hypothetical protein n=1 Tax=Niallia circulans TaxID=1397 RepID=UPI00148FE7D4|nr:hypothetical protein [Niallia circulans]QJX60375.1 hypothetical protein HLK66_00930 [Niallia circulans]